jgi:Zn-dependent protease with chaperone function
MAWQCLLFGPGLSASGEMARIDIVGDEICIRRVGGPGEASGPTGGADTDEWRVAAADIALRRVGLDEKGVELSWHTLEISGDAPAAGTCACHVLDAAAAAALVRALPAGADLDRRVLARDDQARRSRRRVGWLVLTASLMLPLLAVVWLIAGFGAVADIVVARIPQRQEIALRDRYLERFADDPALRNQGSRHRVVSDIVARLTAQQARYDYALFVAADPTINAFALPGGIIVVNDGLIDATRSAEELAGVLAHEVQHVELRHGLNAIVKQAGLAVLVALFSGDASGTLSGEVGRHLVGLKFSRDAEREADDTGFERLRRSGIDPAGMVSFFLTLDQRRAGAPVQWLSTHPASARRAAALREQLQVADAVPLRVLSFDYLDTWPPPRSSPPGRRDGG